jgi:hypothetical protein
MNRPLGFWTVRLVVYTFRMARFPLPGGQRYEIAAQYWMPSVTAVVLLFMGGWFAASFSQADDAGGAFVTTMTVKGKVIRVKGRPVRVLVPAHTVVHEGSVTMLSARTINLTQTRTFTQTDRAAADTLVRTRSTTISIPTTVFSTQTAVTTVTLTETVPTATTIETTTVTSTVTAPPPAS